MISILGNLGNQGFALPMVQAYPVDVNVQQLLAWNPVEQALDYVPYVGNLLGDFGVTRDLSVGRNAAITGTLAVTGALTGTASVGVTAGMNTSLLNSVGLQFQGTKVVGPGIGGWTAATGTATRTTFDTAAVTLPELAQRVKALIDDALTHGLIKA